MENPIKMDDLGVPLFLETTISPKSLIFPTENSGPMSHLKMRPDSQTAAALLLLRQQHIALGDMITGN